MPRTAQPCPRALAPGARARAGSAAVAVLVLLVVLQIVVLGVAWGGARDQGASVDRVDAARAYYATEGVANMAMREIFVGTDEDGDGGVGTISNDSNAGTDPTISLGQARCASSVSGGVTTYTVSGRSGGAIKKITFTGGAGANAKVVYADTSNQHKYLSGRAGTGWTTPTVADSHTDVTKWVVLRDCPTRSEFAMGGLDTSSVLRAGFWTGGSFGSSSTVTTDTGTYATRPFDLAYEQASGDLLAVYWDAANAKVAYRTAASTTLSAQSLLTLPSATQVNWLALVPKIGSNEIMLLALNSGGRLYACVWDGAAWGSVTTITSTAASASYECFGGAYERVSGRFLLVYGKSTNAHATYRTYTSGGGWSAAASTPTIGSNGIYWVRLAARPGTDEVLMGTMDNPGNVYGSHWSGSAWGGVVATGTHLWAGARSMDVMYDSTGSVGMFAYDIGDTYLRYRTWTGSAFSAQLTGPDVVEWLLFIQFRPAPSGGKMQGLVTGYTNGLYLFEWDGSAFGTATQISTNLQGGYASWEPAMLAVPAQGGTIVQAWQAPAPQ